jgi:hypothetical protein
LFRLEKVKYFCTLFLKIRKVHKPSSLLAGSTHDSHIFQTSQIKDYLDEHHTSLEDGVMLGGDSGYTLKPYLMTPYHYYFLSLLPGLPDACLNELDSQTWSAANHGIDDYVKAFDIIRRHNS